MCPCHAPWPRLQSRRMPTESGVIQTTVLFLLYWAIATAKSSQKYVLPGDDCNHYYRHLEGAEVEGVGSYTYTDSCEIQLHTDGPEHWMFHFTDLSLMNCNVLVEIYDKYDISGKLPPRFTFKCASPDPGIVVLNTSFVRLVLHHHNRTNYNFKITFTAAKPRDRCNGFVCRNRNCISRDLLCDGVNNCFDHTDESENATSYCIKYDPFPGENFAVLFSVVGGSICMGIMAFCCRMMRQKRQQQFEEDMDDLANGPYVKKYAYMYAVIRPNRRHHRRQHSRANHISHVDHSVDEPEF